MKLLTFIYKLLQLPINKIEINNLCIKNNLNIINIINSLIKYLSYDKNNLNINNYIEIFNYYNNKLFYKNQELNIKDLEYLNNYDDNKDIRYILQVIISIIHIKSFNYLNISYEIPFYKHNNNIQLINIDKNNKIVKVKGYQLKKHSYFDETTNIFIIFQCYVISAINMLLQNNDFNENLVINDLSISLTNSENLKNGGNNEIIIDYVSYNNELIKSFQKILINPKSNNLKTIKTELNKITKNKYLLGLSPIKIYPHILLNDLLLALNNIQFTQDCKIFYYDTNYNYKYTFIFDLDINIKYINDIHNYQNINFNFKTYNLYDEILKDHKYNLIQKFPLHFYISSTCNDQGIYKIYKISNDCINNNEKELIKTNYKKINIFPLTMNFKNYFIFNNIYKLNKFVVFNILSHHFTVYKFKNNKLIRLDGYNSLNVDIINKNQYNNLNYNFKDIDKYFIYMDNENVYDIVGYYKIVLLQYDKQ